MTLQAKIKFIDDLISENGDVTISDYLFAIQEIEWIEITTDMPKTSDSPRITDTQKETIIRFAAEGKTAKAIAIEVGVSVSAVYNICSKVGGSIKELHHPGSKASVDRSPRSVEKPLKIQRPPSEYSNHSPWGIAS